MKAQTFWWVFPLWLFYSCAPGIYNSTLIPSTKNQVVNNIYGAFITAHSGILTWDGELICFQNDSIYVLTENALVSRHLHSIDSMELYLAKSKKNNFALWGTFAILPPLLGATIHSEYSSEFLTLGLPIAVLNLAAWGAESSRKSHIVRYPQEIDQIETLFKYARFPFGFPQGMTRNDLELAIS